MVTKIAKYVALLFIYTLLYISTINKTYASEGTAELRSETDADYRCFAASLLMQNTNYRIIVSCRDLLYPPQPDLFTYIMWANPLEGSNPIKFGELGIGKATFEVREPFSSLYVTTERNRGVRRPEGEIVMTGRVEAISFLDRPTTPTPTPEGEEVDQDEIEPPEQLTTGQKLGLALRRAGLVIFLALAATVGLVFVLTRSRK